ncbi:MAG: hypothetical protein IT462_01570 [Planctomycetes bacterium]|nr:hypothetical protein [Planctomycetota bacterium]
MYRLTLAVAATALLACFVFAQDQPKGGTASKPEIIDTGKFSLVYSIFHEANLRQKGDDPKAPWEVEFAMTLPEEGWSLKIDEAKRHENGQMHVKASLDGPAATPKRNTSRVGAVVDLGAAEKTCVVAIWLRIDGSDYQLRTVGRLHVSQDKGSSYTLRHFVLPVVWQGRTADNTFQLEPSDSPVLVVTQNVPTPAHDLVLNEIEKPQKDATFRLALSTTGSSKGKILPGVAPPRQVKARLGKLAPGGYIVELIANDDKQKTPRNACLVSSQKPLLPVFRTAASAPAAADRLLKAPAADGVDGASGRIVAVSNAPAYAAIRGSSEYEGGPARFAVAPRVPRSFMIEVDGVSFDKAARVIEVRLTGKKEGAEKAPHETPFSVGEMRTDDYVLELWWREDKGDYSMIQRTSFSASCGIDAATCVEAPGLLEHPAKEIRQHVTITDHFVDHEGKLPSILTRNLAKGTEFDFVHKIEVENNSAFIKFRKPVIDKAKGTIRLDYEVKHDFGSTEQTLTQTADLGRLKAGYYFVEIYEHYMEAKNPRSTCKGAYVVHIK